MIRVTQVKVVEHHNSEHPTEVLAFARVVLNDELVIQGIALHWGKMGPIPVWPGSQRGSVFKADAIFPITLRLREEIDGAILEEYRKISTHPAE